MYSLFGEDEEMVVIRIQDNVSYRWQGHYAKRKETGWWYQVHIKNGSMYRMRYKKQEKWLNEILYELRKKAVRMRFVVEETEDE